MSSYIIHVDYDEGDADSFRSIKLHRPGMREAIATFRVGDFADTWNAMASWVDKNIGHDDDLGLSSDVDSFLTESGKYRLAAVEDGEIHRAFPRE